MQQSATAVGGLNNVLLLAAALSHQPSCAYNLLEIAQFRAKGANIM
jgi:hypothetical protein